MPSTSEVHSQETLPAIVNRMAEADPHKLFPDGRRSIRNLGTVPGGDDPLGGALPCAGREDG
jgi:hypothetical protein